MFSLDNKETDSLIQGEEPPSPPPPRTRPPPPPPSATHAEIQAFLADYISYSKPLLPESEINKLAGKISVDGEQIYELTEQRWADELGIIGECIYNDLQRGEYGYVG